MAREVSALARDHVDDSEEGVVTIERRTGTADDFHSFNQIHVQRKIEAEERRVVNRLVYAMAIDGHKRASTKIAGPVHSPDAKEIITPVSSHIQTAHSV